MSQAPPIEPDGALALDDVRQIVRILGSLAVAEGSTKEKRIRLMDGLCEMVQGDCWLWTMMGEIDTKKAPAHTIYLKNGFTNSQFTAYLKAQEHPDLRWMTAPFLEALARSDRQVTRTSAQMNRPEDLQQTDIMDLFVQAGMDQVLLSGRPTRLGQLSVIVIGRRPGQTPFSDRQSRIAHILLSEIPWLHDESWPEHPRDGITRLAPRQRTVLTLLLQGLSRKQIAGELDLSIHTIGDYVKEIYRAFDVHSQSELLRRFVEGDGGDRP